MKNKRILLALLALALAATTALPAAMAYFTTNARATGTRTLELGGRTTIEEEMEGWVKQLTVSADPDSQPMWVRARAYSGASGQYTYIPGDGWEQRGDWYYFTTPLANPPTEGTLVSTSKLEVEVTPPPLGGDQTPDAFDVVIVYESAPVLYGTDGQRLSCDHPDVWKAAAPPAGT